ncbi:hypothetical protein D3C81_2279410 [compost metagenome]
MVPYRDTHSAAAPSTFSHIVEPLKPSPVDQVMEKPLRWYIQYASAVKVTRITGPAKDS